MQRVYFISGLGADKRAFRYLDLSFCDPVFVEWIKPEPGEAIEDYARRLRSQIADEMPVIVGLSFGGMIAIEIARQIPVKKLILLSSAKTEKEIPGYLRYMRYIPLHRVVPSPVIRSANRLAYIIMGIAKRHDKVLFQQMFNEADDDFISWAIGRIIHWKHNTLLPNITHIHGTADILLPLRYVKADHTIVRGKHLMLMQQPEIISRLLKEVITDGTRSGV